MVFIEMAISKNPFLIPIVCRYVSVRFFYLESPAIDQSDWQCFWYEPVSKTWSTYTGEGTGTANFSFL